MHPHHHEDHDDPLQEGMKDGPSERRSAFPSDCPLTTASDAVPVITMWPIQEFLFRRWRGRFQCILFLLVVTPPPSCALPATTTGPRHTSYREGKQDEHAAEQKKKEEKKKKKKEEEEDKTYRRGAICFDRHDHSGASGVMGVFLLAFCASPFCCATLSPNVAVKRDAKGFFS